MAGKEKHSGKGRGEAVQVFRQFAWNLAGTLANVKAGTQRGSGRSRPVKSPGVR
jgi:hypothetical protein